MAVLRYEPWNVSTLHIAGHGRCRERQCVGPQRGAGDCHSQAAESAASAHHGEVRLDRFAARCLH